MRNKWNRFAVLSLMILLVVFWIGCQSTSVRSAKIYLQQDDPENAKEVLLQGAETTPDDPEVWYLLGRVHAELEEWEEMNDAFVRASELSDEFDQDIKNTREEAWRLKYNAAVKPFNEGNFEDAIEILNTALVIKPGDAETHKRIGLAYLQLEEFDKAEKHLEAAIESQGDTVEFSTYYNLLLLHWGQENFEKSIDVADRILATHRETLAQENPEQLADVVQKKALALQQLGRMEDAVETWAIAIENNPDNADFHFNKALLLHSLERYDEAADEYMRAIELNPEDDEARMNAARALLASEKWDAIITVLEPYLFEGGNVSMDNRDMSVTDLDGWQILRAAYINNNMPEKAEVVENILVKMMQEDEESGS